MQVRTASTCHMWRHATRAGGGLHMHDLSRYLPRSSGSADITVSIHPLAFSTNHASAHRLHRAAGHNRNRTPRSRTPITSRGTAPHRSDHRPTIAAPPAAARTTSSTPGAAAARGSGAAVPTPRLRRRARPRPRPRPPPSSHTQVHHRPVRGHGAPSSIVPTQHSTPVLGVNARSHPTL